ncbi:hypothetical protein [Desemzia sp. FAM 24101]
MVTIALSALALAAPIPWLYDLFLFYPIKLTKLWQKYKEMNNLL